jgi:hypothetical protein
MMAHTKPTREEIDKVLRAIAEDLATKNQLPEVMAAIAKRIGDTGPKTATAATRAIIEQAALSLPENEREAFLQELLGIAGLP